MSDISSIGPRHSWPGRPLRVEDCVNHLVDFVTRYDLKSVIEGCGQNVSEGQLRESLNRYAETASVLPLSQCYGKYTLPGDRTLAMRLVTVSLYDLTVLIGTVHPVH